MSESSAMMSTLYIELREALQSTSYRFAEAERLLRELGTRDDTMAGLFVDRKRHIENCWCGFPIEDVIDGQRNQVEHEPLCQRIRAFLEPPR